MTKNLLAYAVPLLVGAAITAALTVFGKRSVVSRRQETLKHAIDDAIAEQEEFENEFNQTHDCRYDKHLRRKAILKRIEMRTGKVPDQATVLAVKAKVK